ncbi:hypothetical protein ACO0OL_001949 [Hanseniaspora opuntiae]
MTEEIDEYDYIVVGSSLVNGLLTNVLGWKGFRVLSIDENPYYGDYTASLSLDQVEERFSKESIKYHHELIEQNKSKFGLELIPSYILCNSRIIDYISNFNIYRYIEVTKLQDFYTYNNGGFDLLKTTKEDIFVDTSMSPITKRVIMKCIKFLIRDETVNDPDMVNTQVNDDIWNEYKDRPLLDLLQAKFKKLPENLINEFVYTICNSFDIDGLSTAQASAKITKFFKSYNIHGKFPALVARYSGLMEIVQGTYRSAALINNILRLETHITGYDEDSGVITLSSGEKCRVKEKIVLSHHQLKSINNLNLEVKTSQDIHRCVMFIKGSLQQLNSNYSNGCVVSFPPNSLINEAYHLKHVVQLTVLSASLERCIKNYDTVLITAHDANDLDQIKTYLSEKNDVGMLFDYNQGILESGLNKGRVVVLPDTAEPCALDLDHHLNLAIGTYNQLVNNEGDDFMSINLPSNDD